MAFRATGAIHVDLPSVNPFASETRAPRRGGGMSIGWQGRLAQTSDDEEFTEVEDGNVTVDLPSVNPFATSNGRQSSHRSRPEPRLSHTSALVRDLSEDEGDYTRNGTATARHATRTSAPFPIRRSDTAPVGGLSGGSASRVAATRARFNGDDQYDEPVSQRVDNSRRPRQPARPSEDNGDLVITLVDEVPSEPPSPKPQPREAPLQRLSISSDVDSLMEPSFARPPGGLAPPINESDVQSERTAAPVHGHGFHESHAARKACLPSHSRHHCRHRDHCHCHHDEYPHPYWYPPIPVPPPGWPHYSMPPQPYIPRGPHAYPFGHPRFANIPELPSLLDQCRAPYPPLPVPPDALLHSLEDELQANSLLSSVPKPNVPLPQEFDKAFDLIQTNNSLGFLSALTLKELNASDADRVFRTLNNIVQVRFGERQGDKTICRVHLVPRGRLALGTIMAAHPKLDVDLIVPSDFILRRWCLFPKDDKDEQRPKTISDALGLNPASIARGEIDAARIHWVFQAVWEQLSGSADGFVFPGGNDEASRYLPQDWCKLYKGDGPGSNRLRLVTGGIAPIFINVFVKVAFSLYGQEMIVGADQSSAVSGEKYQMVKVLRNPGIPLSPAPLSPVDRTAILTLYWWQSSLKLTPPTGGSSAKLPGSTLRTSHLILALSALHQLDPTDQLYVSPATSSTQPFSLVQVLQTMLKILRYLERAYKAPLTVMGAPVPGASGFPLSSCTLMDTLYSQALAKTGDLLSTRLALPIMITKILGGIGALEGMSLRPSIPGSLPLTPNPPRTGLGSPGLTPEPRTPLVPAGSPQPLTPPPQPQPSPSPPAPAPQPLEPVPQPVQPAPQLPQVPDTSDPTTTSSSQEPQTSPSAAGQEPDQQPPVQSEGQDPQPLQSEPQPVQIPAEESKPDKRVIDASASSKATTRPTRKDSQLSNIKQGSKGSNRPGAK